MAEDGMLKKSINSGKWLTLGFILQKFFGFFSFLILARLLAPADFGIMAIVFLMPKFLQTTTEAGLTTAAIQKGGDIKKYLDPIWTIGIIKSSLILIITFFAGPIIADFFHAESASLAVRLGGLFIFIQNLANIGELYFFKNINFKKIFIRNLSKEISYIITAIIAIFFIQSYWVLLLATLASYITQMLSTYILHPYRPKFTLKWKSLKELIGYSKWLVGRNLLNQSYGAIENTLVARLTDIHNMGLYSKGKSMASMVPGFLSSVMNNISFSAYSALKDSKDKICEGIVKSLHLLFFIAIPLTFLIMLATGKIILVLIGEQWLPMVNVIRLMLIFYILNNLVEISFIVFEAVGLPNKSLKFDSIKIPLTIILIIILTKPYGINGTAAAILIGTLPIVFIIPTYIKKLIGLKYRAIIKTAVLPTMLSAILSIPLLIYKNYILQWNTIYLILLTLILGGLYLLPVYFIGKKWNYGPYNTIKIILKSK